MAAKPNYCVELEQPVSYRFLDVGLLLFWEPAQAQQVAIRSAITRFGADCGRGRGNLDLVPSGNTESL